MSKGHVVKKWDKWRPRPLFLRIRTHWSDRDQIGSKWVWWKVWQ